MGNCCSGDPSTQSGNEMNMQRDTRNKAAGGVRSSNREQA